MKRWFVSFNKDRTAVARMFRDYLLWPGETDTTYAVALRSISVAAPDELGAYNEAMQWLEKNK